MHPMKIAFLIFVSILMGLTAQADPAPSDQSQSQLTVEMRDGSRVVGQPAEPTLSFHSTTVGDMKLPWSGIRTIECADDSGAAHLTATNGDAFTIQLSAAALELQTEFGKAELPVKLIRGIKVELPSKSNSLSTSGAGGGGTGTRLTVVLRDGSRLVGKGSDDTMSFHSTAMGDLKLTWAGIRSIVCADAGKDTAQLTATNGDVYEVQFGAPTVHLETSFGPRDVSVKLIRSIGVSTEGAVGEHMVGWWKLDDGSGTVAKDSGPDSHDGNLTNGPMWITDSGKASLEFNGAGQYVSLGSILQGSYSEISVACWIKSSTFNSQTVLQRDDWNNSGGVNLCVENSHAEFGHAEAKVVSHSSLADNQWHHLVGTMSQGDSGAGYVYNIYVDGKLSNTTAFPVGLTAASNGWAIGAEFNGSFCFQGMIGDVRIYDRALSADEVEAIYDEQSNERGSPRRDSLDGAGPRLQNRANSDTENAD